jgi:hypothetical protein
MFLGSRSQRGGCLAGYLYKFFGWDRAPRTVRVVGSRFPKTAFFLAPPPVEANAARDNGLVFFVLNNPDSGQVAIFTMQAPRAGKRCIYHLLLL